MLPLITMECRAVADAELRFTPSGVAVGSVRVVASSRKKNEETGQWEDDKTVWLTVKTFKTLAENVAESVAKGDLLVVTGRLQQDDWEDRDGNKRTNFEVLADAVAPSLQFRTVPHGAGRTERAAAKDDADPWASKGGAEAAKDSAPPEVPQSDEPPF